MKSLLKWWRKLGGNHRSAGSCSKCWSLAWRPAVQGYSPVRICGKCAHVDPLTIPEFYAQFGTMPYVGIIGK